MTNTLTLKVSARVHTEGRPLKSLSLPLKSYLIKWFVILCCFGGSDVLAQEATSPVAVSVTTARRGTIVSTKQYAGHLEPQAEVEVFANLAGKIVALNAKVGQRVAKGDVLAETQSSSAILAVIRAESTLRGAESRLASTLANAQSGVESQWTIAQEALMTAQSQLVETKSLAEMRLRNQLAQAEAAYQAAQETIEKSKTNAEQALERATVELDKAQLDFERIKSLHEKQHVSDSDFESVENRLKVAQTRHKEAVVTAAQFTEEARHPSVEKAKAELNVAQKLVEIRGWEREIALAESNVTQAQATLDAAQKLVEAKSWEHDIEIASAAVSQAEEQLKVAREELSDAIIKSPISGVVTTQASNLGDHALSAASPSGKPLFTLIGVDTLTAVWHIPAGEARSINTGELVLISTDSGTRNIAGTIDFISPTVDSENNTVLVQASVPNSIGTLAHNSGLRPGSAITVSIQTGKRKNVQLLPVHAVLHIQNGSGTIFTLRGNAAHREQVTVGGVYGGEIEVTSRLANGTQVIVSEHHRLQEGTPVSIVRE